MTDVSKSRERSGRRRRRLLSPVQKYEAFVQVLTGPGRSRSPLT